MRKKKTTNSNGVTVDLGHYVRISFHGVESLEEVKRRQDTLGESFARCAGKNGGAVIVSIKPDAHAEGVLCVKISGNMSPAQAGILGEYRCN